MRITDTVDTDYVDMGGTPVYLQFTIRIKFCEKAGRQQIEGTLNLVLVSTFTKIFLQGNSITCSRDHITCRSSITV
jgi:hypothetical protein